MSNYISNPPVSKKWDTYDELYKLNEDSYLDKRGDMILTTISTDNTLVVDAYLLAAVPDFNYDNDMATAINAANEKVNRPSISWQVRYAV